MKKKNLIIAAISCVFSIPLVSCKLKKTYYENAGSKFYRVNFNSNGGSYVASLSTSLIENEPVSTKKGYTLNGWYIEDENSLINFPYSVENDVTLNASWAKGKYNVDFVTNGGSLVESLKDAEVIETSPTTTQEGYLFEGWHLKSDLSDEAISFPYVLEENVLLYAEWSRNEVIPSGQYLACAKVDNMKAKSYWSFEYLEDSIYIHAEVSDICVYTYNDNPGYNDNVEIIISPKTRNIISGLSTSHCYHFLVDANGNGYYNYPTNLYSWSNNLSAPSTCTLRAQRTTILEDGFNGYKADFDIKYQLFGLDRESALNNLTLSVGMRNSNSYTATSWGYSASTSYLDNWSYYLLNSDGTFALSEVNPDTLIINESIYSPANWTSINQDLSTYDVRVYSQEMKLQEWIEKAPEIASINAGKVILNIGRYSYYLGKLKNTEMVEKIELVIKSFLIHYEKENIFITSIEPLKNYATRIGDLKELNTLISNKCSELHVNYIDTISMFLNGDGSLNKDLYKNNFVFTSSGYSQYLETIRAYL